MTVAEPIDIETFFADPAFASALLVAQGANDVRVVQAESDNIVAPLRARGVPVTYLVADDGHGFDNPENQIMQFRANEQHLAEHLAEREARA